MIKRTAGSTRGRTVLLLDHAGGTVRTICTDDIGPAIKLLVGGGPSAEFTESVLSLLSDRIYQVDLIPASTRIDPKLLEKIARQASKLKDLLSEAGESGSMVDDLLNIIKFEPSEIQGETRDLLTWLVRLENFRHYFSAVDVTSAYKVTIRKLRDAVVDEGYSGAVHEDSQFMNFLRRLEQEFPKLIFPPENIPQGQVKYVQRSLE